MSVLEYIHTQTTNKHVMSLCNQFSNSRYMPSYKLYDSKQ